MEKLCALKKGGKGGNLKYTILNIGSLPVGGKTVDLSAYDFYEVVTGSIGVSGNSFVYTGGLISLDGGLTEDYYFINNANIGETRLIAGKKITIKNAYTSAISDYRVLILHS